MENIIATIIITIILTVIITNYYNKRYFNIGLRYNILSEFKILIDSMEFSDYDINDLNDYNNKLYELISKYKNIIIKYKYKYIIDISENIDNIFIIDKQIKSYSKNIEYYKNKYCHNEKYSYTLEVKNKILSIYQDNLNIKILELPLYNIYKIINDVVDIPYNIDFLKFLIILIKNDFDHTVQYDYNKDEFLCILCLVKIYSTFDNSKDLKEILFIKHKYDESLINRFNQKNKIRKNINDIKKTLDKDINILYKIIN
ncbi:MAG: hypothetical protein WDA02_07595 [Saccharofermentanales bacterium]|jgi:hypothetical protein